MHHSVTYYLAAATFPPLSQPKLVLPTPERCKAELTWLVVLSKDTLSVKNGHLSQN